MATVPKFVSLSVAPTAAPNVQLQNANTADLTTIGARQAQQLGNAIGGAGAALEGIRYQAMAEANALRTADALNQYEEEKVRLRNDPKEGYTALKGYDAMPQEGSLPLAEKYTAMLDKVESRIASTLANDSQRQTFLSQTRPRRTQFLGDALQYESQQGQEHTLSVREARVKVSANGIVLDSDNPESVAMHATALRASITGAVDPDTGVLIKGTAQLLGKSAAWANEKADEAISGAHTAAVSKYIEMGDMSKAMAYRKRYGQSMTATDMLKVDGTLLKNYETMRGAAIGSEIVKSTQTTVQPSDMNRLTNIVRSLESGTQGAFGADGKLLQGPMTRTGERAQGDMQVMPATARDPGYGIKSADLTGTPQQQAGELARVGREKLSVLVKMYDGDVAKALGAYNWGEGNVDKAVRAAQSNAGKGERVGRDDWLASAPAETRAYVTKALQQLQTGGGAPARPTLADLQGAARERLGPNASPFATKQAMDTIEQQFTAQNNAIEQRKDETVAVAYQALEQAGGRWSDVPPNIRAKVQELAPDKLDDLRNFGVRASKGDDVTDDRLYLRLTTNPQSMAQMSDAQFYQLRGGLSKSDFDHFTKMRADIKAGKTSDSAGDLNTGAVSRFTDARLRGLGMDPTPKDGSTDAQAMGARRRFIDSSLLDAQRQAGKKFTDAEVQQHIDGLFAQNVQFRSSFLGIFNSTTNRQLLSMKPGDIPGDQADRIRKAFKAQGNASPSEGDILGAYMAGVAGQRNRDPKTGAW